jgi:transcriptional regulator GlxA family with amidase domain
VAAMETEAEAPEQLDVSIRNTFVCSAPEPSLGHQSRPRRSRRCSGAALSHPDLTLALIRSADPLIRRFERWARGHLHEGFSLDEIAKSLGTSKRTLARRMHGVLGKTPLAFFQDLRIERAVHLLRTSRASVDQIAAKVGYAKGVTLRALLRRKLGRGAS